MENRSDFAENIIGSFLLAISIRNFLGFLVILLIIANLAYFGLKAFNEYKNLRAISAIQTKTVKSIRENVYSTLQNTKSIISLIKDIRVNHIYQYHSIGKIIVSPLHDLRLIKMIFFI